MQIVCLADVSHGMLRIIFFEKWKKKKKIKMLSAAVVISAFRVNAVC